MIPKSDIKIFPGMFPWGLLLNVLRCVAMCCDVLRCVAMCCNVANPIVNTAIWDMLYRLFLVELWINPIALSFLLIILQLSLAPHHQ